MGLRDSVKDSIDNLVGVVLAKSKSKDTKSAYYVLDEVRDNKAFLYNDQKFETYDEQVSNKDQPSEKGLKYYGYALSNFFKPVFTFRHKDYKTGKVTNGVIRGSNKTQALLNAKEVYNLQSEPEKIQEIVVSPDRLLDKVKTHPTFFLSRRVKKGPLGEFLVEYASLREDGFDKGQAIDVLKDMIKNKALVDFMNQLRSSNLLMSDLMTKMGTFDDYTISIVKSSELAGGDSKLYAGLTKLGENYIAEATFKKKFLGSLVYPAFLITITIGIGIFAVLVAVPMLAALFIELAGEEKLPGIMKTLLNLNHTFLPTVGKIVGIILILWIIKKILLTNGVLLGMYQRAKLKIPLYGDIVQRIEENRLFTILLQTATSNLSEVQKIQSLEKSTPNILYKGYYRTMAKKYPTVRDFTRTVEVTNEMFGNDLFSKRMLTTLQLTKASETNKKLGKYEKFIDKNTDLLYKRLKTVNTIFTVFTTLVIASLVFGMFAIIFSFMTTLMSSV